MKLNLFKNFLVIWVIIPFLLFFLWLGLSLIYTSQYSFSVIASPYEKNNFTVYKNSELLAKEKVSAQFRAKEDNLGIVSVRFYNFQRISKDRVTFRLKEKYQKKWYYEHTYKVDQFQSDKLFTFGFPIIPDSKNREYVFEIESLEGEIGDAIALGAVYPPFVAQYQYSKQELLKDRINAVNFLAKKIYYSFNDRNFLVSSYVYLLPLIFYLILCFLTSGKPMTFVTSILWINTQDHKRISITLGKNYILIFIYLFSVAISIIFIDELSIYVELVLIAIWIWLIKLYRFDNSISYILGFFLLLICPLLIILGQDIIAQRVAVWVYFYLAIGTIEAFAEMRWKFKNLVSYDQLLKQNFILDSKKNK